MMAVSGCDDEKDIPGIHLLNVNTEDINAVNTPVLSPKDAVKRRLWLIRKDKKYRKQVIYASCIAWAIFVQGWIKGQIGPVFPDLLNITQTDLKRGSAYLTAFYVGKVVGSGSGGFLFDKCKINWFISITELLLTVAVASVPWCTVYEAMIAVFTFIGVLHSFGEVALITSSLRIFGDKDSGILHINFLIVSVSSAISPLATAPFLLPIHEFENTTEIVSPLWIVNVTAESIMLPNYHLNNYSHAISETFGTEQRSSLYIPLLITASIILVTSILFCSLSFWGFNNVISKGNNKNASGTSTHKISTLTFVICLILACICGTLICALEVSMGNLLSTFCMKQFGWTPAKGALAISLFFFSYLFGRFTTIICSKIFQPSSLLCIFTVLCALGFSLFILCVHLYYDIGIWISTALCGLSVSVLYPVMLVWLNHNILFVSGKLTSLVLITSYVGSMANPPILSYLMEKVKTEWFTYINMIESFLLIVTIVTMACYTKISVSNTR